MYNGRARENRAVFRVVLYYGSGGPNDYTVRDLSHCASLEVGARIRLFCFRAG